MNLINNDCLDALKELPDNSVDLTVTSPPYDSLRNYEGLPFSKFTLIAKELFRVTKVGGVIVWVVGDQTINGSETGTSFKQALFFKECGFKLHDTMIYAAEKPPLTHKRYEQKFEYMFVFCKGKLRTFNPIKEKCKWAGDNKKRTFRHNRAQLDDWHGSPIVKDEKIKGNIWSYGVGNGKSTLDKYAFKHPAIFPEKLAHDHIISWSNPGDIVLDPFMGSGTTGKMAILNNRKFIGIEKEKEYFGIARARIGI
jgi:site-specific DNA-methyltransferase (adenine-specific)